MLEQSDWDRATGKKCERCRCPHCLDPSLVPAGSPRTHACHYPDCGRAYKKTSHLRSHLRAHVGDQPFACSVFNR